VNEAPEQRQGRLPGRTLRRRGPSSDKNATANPAQSFGGISIGDRFGKLAVVRRAGNRGQHAFWECLCECESGKAIAVRGDHLRDGRTVSCGCARSDYQEARLLRVEKAISLKNFGKMFVLGTAREFMGRNQVHAVCVCRYCSGTSVQRASDVLRKNFRGCDCVFQETLRDRMWKYGYPPPSGKIRRRIPIEVVKMQAEWRSMISRCHDPKNRDYPGWGGRGIIVCERWRTSFRAYLDDNGVKPLEKTLDRLDNNGPYSPENCKWSTGTQQTRNRRNTIFIEHQGDRITLSELATRLRISYPRAYRRYRKTGTVRSTQ
jgi:hypothetical protein